MSTSPTVLDLPEPTSISAGALHLRPWEPSDAAAVLAACDDPLVQRWTQVPVPYTPEHARDYVEGADARWRRGEELGLAVCDSTTGEVLASAGLRPYGDGTWDVGCWAVAGARGRGVVPEAVAALSRWAFAVLGAQRVQWRASTRNWSSRRAAQKAGFTAEGVLRGGLLHRGQREDAWLAARRPGDPDGDTARLPRVPPQPVGDRVLRRYAPDDVDAVAVALREGLGVPGMFVRAAEPDEQRARWWVEQQAPEREEAGAGLAAGLWDGDRLVASVQLMLAGRRAGLAEVGIWVAPEQRRTGTGTAAVAALLAWARPALRLVRVEWLADPANAASVALAERLGFVREGVARAALPDDDAGRLDAVVLAKVWP